MKEKLEEIFEDERYAINDGFTIDEICSIVEQLTTSRLENGVLRIGATRTAYMGDYTFKMSNVVGGWVSCSDGLNTGVSRTEYIPYYHDCEDEYDGLKNLVEMISEAYYLCSD